MHQVKIFKGVENEADKLERDVNDWLKKSGVKVVKVFGNLSPQSAIGAPSGGTLVGAETAAGRRFAPSDILLVVVYESK